jgi:hypothetical protein
MRRMRLGFDESGDFSFDKPGLSAGVVAGVVCPDSLEYVVAAQMDMWRSTWGMRELHAAKMMPSQLVDVCAWIGASPLTWVATYTDSRLFPFAQQLDWRARQQAKAEAAIAASRTLPNDDVRRSTVATMRGRLEHDSRVTTSEYLEFLILYPAVVGKAVQAAIAVYQDEAYAADFYGFVLEFDGKLRGKRSRAEKTMVTALRYILVGDDRFALDLPPWPDDHPCFVNHPGGTPRSIAVTEVLRDLQFPDSSDSNLVQLADVIANLLRRAGVDPRDALAQRCWTLLRRRGFVRDDVRLHLFRDRKGPVVNPAHYAHLV